MNEREECRLATFRARLRGRNEVPPVITNASGSAVFREIFGRTGVDRRRVRALQFRLTLNNIRRVTQAHIHLGRPGQNGPVVAFLFGPNRQGVSFRRGVIRGTLRSNDLVGPLRGQSIRALVREIERGNAYVNVHTVRNPDGEIRGQIR
ncbi:CHRD domain-containing protein [Paenibacillus sp. MY03]|nr:CHRD domain-containing protein [Paenibacillus sp. MY03]